MRTHTAPWDMRPPRATAFPVNDTCPKCGSPCNCTVVVDEKLYFCKSCGTVKVDISAERAEARHYSDYLAGREQDPRD
jgi:transcription elongation factor Elf1